MKFCSAISVLISLVLAGSLIISENSIAQATTTVDPNTIPGHPPVGNGANGSDQTVTQPPRPSLSPEAAKTAFVSMAGRFKDTNVRPLTLHGNGRIKPFDTFARETNLFLTGKRALWGLTPIQFYIGLILFEDRDSLEIIDVRDTQARKTLGLATNQKMYSISGILKTNIESMIGPLAAKEKENKRSLTEEEKGILEISHQISFARFIGSGEHLLSAVDFTNLNGPQTQTTEMPPVLNMARTYLSQLANFDPSNEETGRNLVSLAKAQQVPELFKHYMDKMELEVFFNDARIFFWTAIFYILISIVLIMPNVADRIPKMGLAALLALPVIAHITGFSIRVYITGFAPVTNMYGTMLWVSFGIALFSLVLFQLYQNRLLVGFLLAGSAVVLLITESFPLVLSPDMDPIVAVLRSNFWLTIHVLTITISYAALTICMLIGNFALIRTLIRQETPLFYKTYAHFTYRMMQLGVFLLTVGIILGGIWADYSWGRFWGWDPKETWALIADVGFLAILHSRFIGWLGPFGVLAASPVAYLLVVMAWYGVNFILAAGLHSYGFSSGGTAMVVSFVVAQMLLLIVSYVIHKSRQQKTPSATKA